MKADLCRRRLLLALWALASDATAIGSAAGAPRARPAHAVRIGLSGPFSGPSRSVGLSMREGAHIAAAHVNAAGGVLGVPLQLIERDDEASNEGGARVAQQLIHDEDVAATVGITHTGVALASQRHYQAARIPLIIAVATGSMITRQFQRPDFADNYIFRVAASDDVQAQAMVSEAVDCDGLRRLAIFHDGSNYGVLGSANLSAVLRTRALQPVLSERAATDNAGVDAQLRRARAAAVQAILVYGAGTALAPLVRGTARLGWRVPILGSDALAGAAFIAAAGRSADGVRMPQTFVSAAAGGLGLEFVRAWRARAHSELAPVPPAAAQGYDSTLILAAAINQARSLDGRRIREALENLQTPVHGMIMVYDPPYSRDRHETLTDPGQLAIGEIRGGRVVLARAASGTRKLAAWP